MHALAIPLHLVILRESFLAFLGLGKLSFGLLAALAGGFLLFLGFRFVGIALGALDGALRVIDSLFNLIPRGIERDDFARHFVGGFIFWRIVAGEAADDQRRARLV